MAKKKNLTDEIIYQIYTSDLPAKELAEKYGVSVSTISRIKNLALKKYRDAVEKMKNSKKKVNQKKEKIYERRQKLKDNVKITQDKLEKIKEKIQKLTTEMLIADLIAILDKYFSPIVIKCIYDNILSSEKFKALIDNTVKQIKEAGEPQFYVEAVRTLILGLLLQIVREEYIPKILKD